MKEKSAKLNLFDSVYHKVADIDEVKEDFTWRLELGGEGRRYRVCPSRGKIRQVMWVSGSVREMERVGEDRDREVSVYRRRGGSASS